LFGLLCEFENSFEVLGAEAVGLAVGQSCQYVFLLIVKGNRCDLMDLFDCSSEIGDLINAFLGILAERMQTDDHVLPVVKRVKIAFIGSN
jgi:hypothetical protein